MTTKKETQESGGGGLWLIPLAAIGVGVASSPFWLSKIWHPGEVAARKSPMPIRRSAPQQGGSLSWDLAEVDRQRELVIDKNPFATSPQLTTLNMRRSEIIELGKNSSEAAKIRLKYNLPPGFMPPTQPINQSRYRCIS